MKTRVLISFMAAALWLMAAPAYAEQNTATGAPDSSGRVVEKPDANMLDHGAPNDPTTGKMAPDSSGRAVAKPDANTLDQGAPNDPDSARDVPDSDGRVVAPDNSGRSATKDDIALTQDIRRAVTKDDSLSTMAQNIKIISVDGVVTLSGPVESEVEQKQVAALAERIAGSGKVQNQLEIAR
jgi:hyperosmotically inducible protein